MREAEFTITLGSVEDIPALEPLWLAVHTTHQEAMPELAPYVTDQQTWHQRQHLYRTLLARSDSFLLLARSDGDLAGYALGFVHDDTDENWTADTWDLDGPIGELESLSVFPEHRGRGLGTALLDAVDDEFARRKVPNQIVGILPGNQAARRLYERRGFRPTWMYLSRFSRR